MCSRRFALSPLFAAMLSVGIGSNHLFGEDVPASAKPFDAPVEKLVVGDQNLTIAVGNRKRRAVVHVPPKYQSDQPTPVVLALHGAAMNGDMMVSFCGLNKTSDEHGFIVVYPSGTGLGPLLTWNAGGFVKGVESRVDDVAFFRALLDDLEQKANVDTKRVFACGMSNGAMMSYRLAAELSDRIAAIAPIGGTMAIGDVQPVRPVSVIHFHGTLDTLVPFDIGSGKQSPVLRLKSVEDSIQTWIKLDGIIGPLRETHSLTRPSDELQVTRQEYGPGTDGAEVVLITIKGGGHTWPGQVPPVEFLGKSAMNIDANELMWTFFQAHPMK